MTDKDHTTYMAPRQLTGPQQARRGLVVRHIAPLLRELDHDITWVDYLVHPVGSESGLVWWLDGRKATVYLDQMMGPRDVLGAYLRAAGIRLK